MKIYSIEELYDGRMAIAPCPLGNEVLDKQIQSLQQRSYALVVSMLTREEQEKHGLNKESDICANHGIAYLNYPIRNEVAESDISTIAFVNKVADLIEALSKDKKVLFHCRGGVGRSSMMLTLVLARLSPNFYDVDDVFAKITQARGEQTPESDEQLVWVKRLVNQR